MDKIQRLQEERMDYLIRELRGESLLYRGLETAPGDRRKMLRSLMNVRMPGPVSPRFRKRTGRKENLPAGSLSGRGTLQG